MFGAVFIIAAVDVARASTADTNVNIDLEEAGYGELDFSIPSWMAYDLFAVRPPISCSGRVKYLPYRR